MTKTLTITTPGGTKIELISEDGSLSANVNGKPHTFGAVSLGWGKAVGDHIALAGGVKAKVAANDLPALRAFFAEAKTDRAAFLAGYEPTLEDKLGKLAEDMDRAGSKY